MKPARNPSRIEARRAGNVLIVAIVLMSLCILSLIKARYCAAPFAKSQALAGAETILKSEEAAITEDEDEEGETTATAREIVAEKAVIVSHEPICSRTSNRSVVCEAEGDVRLQGRLQTVFLPPSLTEREWKSKPYCRKRHNSATMKDIKEWTLKPFPGDGSTPECTVNHSVPALVFSLGGFTGNLFHDFTDVLVPLFISAYRFRGKVQFVVADNQDWWVTKFALIFRQLSDYEIIDADIEEEGEVHCFPRVIVGLRYHKVLGIDPARTPTGYSMVDFKAMLRKAYGLERSAAAARRKPPRLLIIARNKTRVFLNMQGMRDMAAGLGFDVRVAEPHKGTNVSDFARLVNSADVMMGVHGAGLANMVFLPDGAAMIQVVPFGGLDWLARETFGDPAPAMRIEYLEYYIEADESTIGEEYRADDPVIKDRYGVHKRGWNEISRIYLENQNVRPHLGRLRNTLVEALKRLPKGRHARG
ncbi:alpha-1,3-arabinosyltransferase XAT3-like [Curcuma longa]|uniref:alpha-1,3-arabinosyltransferase XAT3-like n=1 Tax=Curcuma longa TaxID=136217 RepID=UPI003D9F23B8